MPPRMAGVAAARLERIRRRRPSPASGSSDAARQPGADLLVDPPRRRAPGQGAELAGEVGLVGVAVGGGDVGEAERALRRHGGRRRGARGRSAPSARRPWGPPRTPRGTGGPGGRRSTRRRGRAPPTPAGSGAVRTRHAWRTSSAGSERVPAQQAQQDVVEGGEPGVPLRRPRCRRPGRRAPGRAAPRTSAASTVIVASAAAGSPNSARAASGCTVRCTPDWRPSWTIRSGTSCRPPTHAANRSRPPSGRSSSSPGPKVTTSVRYGEGRPRWRPGAIPRTS